MSLAKDLEIYRSADALLALSLQVQAQVPRAYRVAVGQRISNECADILLTVARANAAAVKRLQTMPAGDTFASGNSYLGLVRQATHSHADQIRIARVLRQRGHAVAGDIGKVYPRKSTA